MAVLFAGSAGSAAGKGGATKQRSPLTVVAPTEGTRTIRLEPLPQSSGQYLGHLTITIKNRGTRPGRLAVGYLQANGGRYNALAGTTNSPVAPAGELADKALVIRPGQLRPLQLEFTLPKAQPASWLQGTLLLRLRKIGKKGTAATPNLVPVKASFLSLGEVAFDPKALALQVTGGDLEGGSNIDLVGPGAEQMLARTPPFEAAVLLGNGEGNRVSVTLDSLERIGEGRVRGRISVEGDNPGEYTGTLALGPGPAPPSLPITLHARYCIAIAIALILLSSIVGGLLPAFSATARKRALLRTRLRSAIEHLEDRYDSDDNVPLLLWDMTVAMGPRPWLRRPWSSVSQVEGVPGLYAELRWARSDEELDQLGKKVNAAIGDIDRWLVVFERARELRALHRARAPRRSGGDWGSTKVATGAEEFLDGLRAVPESGGDARRIALECVERLWWYQLVQGAWTKIALAEEAGDRLAPEQARAEEVRTKLAATDLSPFTDVAFPTPAERGPLGVALTRLMREVIALAPKFDWSGDHWDATPLDAFVKSATNVEPRSPRPLAGSASASSRLAAQARIGAHRGGRERTLQGLSALDWLVTGALALGATLAYTVPIYGPTWGTTTDLLTALAVGFGTQVVVRWAAMPIFRSLNPKETEADART